MFAGSRNIIFHGGTFAQSNASSTSKGFDILHEKIATDAFHDSAASAIAASTATNAPVTSSSNSSICHGTITGPSSASRWYAVTVGRRVGVSTLWSNVAPDVLRAKGACFARYDSREEAIAAYYGALENGNVHIIL